MTPEKLLGQTPENLEPFFKMMKGKSYEAVSDPIGYLLKLSQKEGKQQSQTYTKSSPPKKPDSPPAR